MQGKCGLFFESYREENALLVGGFQKARFAALLAVLCACPFVLNSYHLSILILINIAVVGAVSLNLLTGMCGQISLGHGAFIGVGAYACGALTLQGVPFLVALPAAGCITAATGMLFGIPSLRLKGIYLAIATLAAQLILQYIFLHWDAVTGGSTGLAVDPPNIAGLTFDTDEKMFYLSLGVAILMLVVATNLMRSRHGRAFVAIRDFYLSAEIVGVNLFAYKLMAFAVSSFMAGVAGGLWGHYLQFVTPEPFGLGLSISYLAMCIIGGLGSIQGAVFGAVFLTLLPEVLTWLSDVGSSVFPAASLYLVAAKEGVFGLVLVLFLIFEPEGLQRRWRLFKAWCKLFPFAY
ncbi:branched-chain amino acid ABC transporter permease [Megalodesulfovibrio gigas]|uniref:Putative ABC transporter permease n=1 Tax=Megalodesulfovibrio gigas (strain ATCC 19364 / DSM 1382 / NCIMB 9332 / VKM B-1759) TaxID=1121448 RepID=T2GCU4_MEGG1|nr:branched-chain amino acid ABC transporter permease [Megalodesulfovibrio gigas]AGW13999.1 putative ABC transporter permease [Megalodesulfovibrio gigas DSM 1382 = ATCC 19364]